MTDGSAPGVAPSAGRREFTGVRPRPLWGRLLPSFSFGQVRQLDAVAAHLLINLVERRCFLA